MLGNKNIDAISKGISTHYAQGAIFILRTYLRPEIDNFPLLYVVKMFLRRWVGGSKKPQNILT